jgi:hypothetical protein
MFDLLEDDRPHPHTVLEFLSNPINQWISNNIQITFKYQSISSINPIIADDVEVGGTWS